MTTRAAAAPASACASGSIILSDHTLRGAGHRQRTHLRSPRADVHHQKRRRLFDAVPQVAEPEVLVETVVVAVGVRQMDIDERHAEKTTRLNSSHSQISYAVF